MMNLKNVPVITGLCENAFTFLLMLILLIAGITPAAAQQTTRADPLSYPVYSGDDLGMRYTPDGTAFRMWSPMADSVRLNLYQAGHGDNLTGRQAMIQDEGGTWTSWLEGDHEGSYYTYQIFSEGRWLQEKPDLYAVSTGINGQRAMILNLETTNPEGWENDSRPLLASRYDIIIYELHIRDLSIHPSSGIKHKGKFLGLTESGTRSPGGLSTGLDHIADMGVTHVHLLPAFDYRSIDESRLNIPQYNWGYDPVNYNVPEGSYSTDPSDGRVRVKEFKEMVMALHAKGLRVIMDVVYNHTSQTDESGFSQLVPDYFYRMREDGTFSDASACGNETASERAMMRKYMIESVEYWVREYHVDGFRFDLMGIHDIETMNELADHLLSIDSTLFIYGEGWTAGASPLPATDQALKRNTWKMPNVAAFSDDLRDGLKGSVFEHEDRGFASGKTGTKESVKFGIVASVQHPQVSYEQVNYSDAPWAKEPYQTITYVSCHDNHTLYDRLVISMPEASDEQRQAMHRLANTIVLLSQGVPFLHAGVEFMRTKHGVENSYNAPDSINWLDWDRRELHQDHVNYYQDLIRFRKAHPAFRMGSASLIREHLTFIPTDNELLLQFEIDGKAAGDTLERIRVVANGSGEDQFVSLPEGRWQLLLDGSTFSGSKKMIVEYTVRIPAWSAVILAAESKR